MATTAAKLTFDEEFTTMPATTPRGYDAAGNPTWRTEWFWDVRYFDPSDGGYWADSTVGYNPFAINNGVLSITSKPLSQTGATGAASYNTHATGMLTTDKLFAQTYGYFEFRAQAATGNGFGTALWLIPQDHSWPPELDVQEIPGASVASGHMIMTTHSNSTGSHVSDGGWANAGVDLSAGLHTYGMDWGPNEVVWYLDGKEVRRTATPPDANKPMYIVMSLHNGTGDSWWGNADDNASATMKVDYVRVWDWQSGGPPQGAVGGPAVVQTPQPISQTIGTGADSLVLKISQDAWQGDANYTIAVDGVQVGGTLVASAAHSAGQDDTITVRGNFGAGGHTVTVNFLNDAYGGDATTDRNLYVDGVSFNGTALASGKADLFANGGASFGFTKGSIASTTPGDIAPAAKFGFAPTYSMTALEGHTTFGGADYHSFRAPGAWNYTPAVLMAPTSWNPAFASKLAFDNFVQTTIDLHAAGSQALDVMLVSAKRGAVTLGDGNDHVTWVAHSNGSGTAANTMAIKTGAGDDVVTITAAGISPLADYNRTGNGNLYNNAYDGRFSIADVTFGTGKDSVTVESKVQLILHAGSGAATAVGGAGNDLFHAGTGTGTFTGGAGKDTFLFNAGDGHAVIQDFTAGTDKLKFTGLTSANIQTKAATEGGVSGLLVTYDSAGDSVFLANVTKLAAADMLFA